VTHAGLDACRQCRYPPTGDQMTALRQVFEAFARKFHVKCGKFVLLTAGGEIKIYLPHHYL